MRSRETGARVLGGHPSMHPLQKGKVDVNIKPIYWFTLYKLAEMGACTRIIRVSTNYLAEKMGCSQQTASRHLANLGGKGWIKRNVSPDGCFIKVTRAGLAELEKVYSELRSMINESTHGAAVGNPEIIVER